MINIDHCHERLLIIHDQHRSVYHIVTTKLNERIMKRGTWNGVYASVLLHLLLDHSNIKGLVEVEGGELHITAS